MAAMTSTRDRFRLLVLTSVVACLSSVVFVGPALGAPADGGDSPSLLIATSEIAQVMLSIGAVAFVIQAARAYGGEIGQALYVAGGGVIIFAIWRLLHGASSLLQLRQPPANVGSVVYLLVTMLLLAGFYMLYDTMSEHSAA
jgi:hypothetical protein